MNMKQVYAILVCFLAVPVSFAAEHETLITEEDLQNTQTSSEINRFLIDQFRGKALNEKERKAAQYLELRKKYPDVVPERSLRVSTASGLSSFVYDDNFVNTIFFSPGSSFLSDVQEIKLNQITETMIEEPAFNLIIVGHSSFNSHLEDGNERLYYNRWISGRRAVQVWDYFVKRGISETRLAAFAKDSQEPLNGEDSVKETNMNRRVELRLTNQSVPVGSGDRVAQRLTNTQQSSSGSLRSQ